jgi:hypothetical protein
MITLGKDIGHSISAAGHNLPERDVRRYGTNRIYNSREGRGRNVLIMTNQLYVYSTSSFTKL